MDLASRLPDLCLPGDIVCRVERLLSCRCRHSSLDFDLMPRRDDFEQVWSMLLQEVLDGSGRLTHVSLVSRT